MRLSRPLAGLLVAGALLALLEGAARLGERVVYGATWSDGQPRGLYVRDPGGRLRLAPGARLPGAWYAVSVNTLGFRGPELEDPKPPGSLRIWCAGGSTTFDIYARDDASTWPARLQARLAAALTDRVVEVLNAGVPGEAMPGSADDLRRLGPSVSPDLVVVYAGANDLRFALSESGTGPPGGVPLASRLGLASFRVLERVATSRGYTSGALPSRALTERERGRLRTSLEGLLDTVTRIGATPVLATHALRPAAGTAGEAARRAAGEMAPLLGLAPESTIEAFEAWNDVVRDVAAARGLPVIDVRAAVPADDRYWGDATHFAAPGSERAAEVLAAGILPLVQASAPPARVGVSTPTGR